MKAQLFKKTFPSELKFIRTVISEIMDYLRCSFPSLSSEDYFDCKLIYNELLINAIIHGNENDKNKTVSVTIEVIDEDSIYSTITDEGNGFDYNHMLKEIENKDRLFLENGRGIQLVQSLTNELHYERSRKQISFYKRMNRNGQNFSCR
ncbi:ATP-binding protein [Defluviitalea saccharophila]|uniref:ATP-binding protein n=1 Tax=Defluviitalea saccharophila TaxID=879970 RepID=A0ABZ2Y0R3_9FIRM|nr:ATP-binding protein [Candidatus Epulonipiscium sp.]